MCVSTTCVFFKCFAELLYNHITFILKIHLQSLYFSFCVHTYKWACLLLVPQPSPLGLLRSDVSGLQLAEHVYLPVAARLAVLLLPVGQEVFVVSRRCRNGRLQADGGAAGFGDRGAVVVEVVVGDGCVSPAGFTPGRLPLNPLPPQRCLGLNVNNNSQLKYISQKPISSYFFGYFKCLL